MGCFSAIRIQVNFQINPNYFMGLRRRQGANPQEGEQFDIRMTVEDFKRDVYAYSVWKPTMWIHVCHVKRKDLPTFVFPGGVRPSPPSRSFESRPKKRKLDEANRGTSLTESASTGACASDATSLDQTISTKHIKLDCSPASAGAFLMEKQIVDQISVNQQGSSEVVDGLEGLLSSETQRNAEAEEVKRSDSFTVEQDVGVGLAGDAASSVQPMADMEELEPLELPISSAIASASAKLPVQKPLIRFSFTSFPKATGNSA